MEGLTACFFDDIDARLLITLGPDGAAFPREGVFFGALGCVGGALREEVTRTVLLTIVVVDLFWPLERALSL